MRTKFPSEKLKLTAALLAQAVAKAILHQSVQHGTGRGASVAVLGKVQERFSEAEQALNFGSDLAQMVLGDGFHLFAGSVTLRIE